MGFLRPFCEGTFQSAFKSPFKSAFLKGPFRTPMSVLAFKGPFGKALLKALRAPSVERPCFVQYRAIDLCISTATRGPGETAPRGPMKIEIKEALLKWLCS